MYIKIDKNDYEVSTNLGTAYDIEAKFGKKIAELVQSIEDFNLEKCLEVIYFGFKRNFKKKYKCKYNCCFYNSRRNWM